jgi:hypothetical protein
MVLRLPLSVLALVLELPVPWRPPAVFHGHV